MKNFQTSADLSKNYDSSFNITRNFDGWKATFSYLINVTFQTDKAADLLYILYKLLSTLLLSHREFFPRSPGSQKRKYFLQLCLCYYVTLFLRLIWSRTRCLLLLIREHCYKAPNCFYLSEIRHNSIQNLNSNWTRSVIIDNLGFIGLGLPAPFTNIYYYY